MRGAGRQNLTAQVGDEIMPVSLSSSYLSVLPGCSTWMLYLFGLTVTLPITPETKPPGDISKSPVTPG